jgi:hypothetical protein
MFRRLTNERAPYIVGNCAPFPIPPASFSASSSGQARGTCNHAVITETHLSHQTVRGEHTSKRYTLPGLRCRPGEAEWQRLPSGEYPFPAPKATAARASASATKRFWNAAKAELLAGGGPRLSCRVIDLGPLLIDRRGTAPGLRVAGTETEALLRGGTGLHGSAAPLISPRASQAVVIWTDDTVDGVSFEAKRFS